MSFLAAPGLIAKDVNRAALTGRDVRGKVLPRES